MVLPRSLLSRLWGTDLGTFVGLFAPVATLGGLGILVNGDDPLVLPLIWLAFGAGLWLLAYRKWCASVSVDEVGIVVQNLFHQEAINWPTIEAVVLDTVRFGAASWWPAPTIRLRSGRQVACRACLFSLRRRRAHHARLLVDFAAAAGTPVVVDQRAARWWHHIADELELQHDR